MPRHSQYCCSSAANSDVEGYNQALTRLPPNKLLELTVDPQTGSLPQTTPRLNGSSTQC